MLRFFMGKKLSLFRVYEYDPFDVSVVMYRVIARRYGINAIFGLRRLFRLGPLPLVSVKTGLREESRGIQGAFRIKHSRLVGEFFMDNSSVYCDVREKYQQEVEKLLDAILEELNERSIYRNKAFSLNREFLDLDIVLEDDVVFSSKTETLLKSQLWAIIEKKESCLSMNIPQRRKILLHGIFGSGKTLVALLTAKKAIKNGWTVIYMPPTDRREAMLMELGLQLARKYQPSVFIIEDIDHEQRVEDPHVFRKTLANMDGVVSKGAKIIVLMTSNSIEKIGGPLLRPGRIDQVIALERLGYEETRKLIQKRILKGRLSSDINWEEVFMACAMYSPAFIVGMAESAALSAVESESGIVTQEMLIEAAENLLFQYEACEKTLRTGQYI